MFVLLMQFVWKYVDDFVGKGLEWYLIAELMFYVSATLVPMALPLAILLASIMTFGNLAESYELTALKSAGVSLQRIMRPLIVLTLITAFSAFLFSNYVLPLANLKMGSLLYDITHQKPALEIREGVFYNGINDYTIRVNKKDNKKNILYGIMIYDHSQRGGNNKVIVAREGKMAMSGDEQYLVLTLKDGYSYEDVINNNNKGYKPMMRVQFKEEKILMDLSDFKMVRTDEDLFKDNHQMLNLSQLEGQADTLKNEFIERQKSIIEQIKRNISLMPDQLSYEPITKDTARVPKKDSLLALLTTADQQGLIMHALNTARSSTAYLSTSALDRRSINDNINRYYIEWHKKFTLSFACLILFFIGAPMGAIIRKGGLGMPLVVSVFFFLIFHILTITGEKFAKESVVTPFQGAWFASFVLLPLGVFLTYKATQDSALFDIEVYTAPIKKLFSRKK
jgi:lipopolysaccharide export system permease protein